MRILKRIGAGVAIGVANIIPGLSGGTMAVILDVYDELLWVLNDLISFKESFWKSFWLICQFGLGIALGCFGLAQVTTVLLETFPTSCYSFFTGLILGSIVIFQSRYRVLVWELRGILIILIGMSLSLGMSLVSVSEHMGEASFYYILISACLASATMLLPGISGSMLLLLLGVYPVIIAGIQAVDFNVLMPLCLGASLGIIGMIKVVSWAISEHPKGLYQLVMGLLIGSAVVIWPGFSVSPMLWLDIALLGAGAVLLKYLG